MFITLEGIEGSGKTILLENLERHFKESGIAYMKTREPGSSWLGKSIRPLLLQSGNQLAPTAELFLFLADRTQHVEDVIRPALEAKKLVICDRYIDSTHAYQGYGRNFDHELLSRFNELASQNLLPDLTLLLDLPVEIGLHRARLRNTQAGSLDQDEGRFEEESLDFHRRVRQGFLDLARVCPRFVILDATQDPLKVGEQAWQAIKVKQAGSGTSDGRQV